MDRCDRESTGDWSGGLHNRYLCGIVLWVEAASAERGAGDDVQGGWGEKAFPFAPPQRLKAHASEPGRTASLKRCPDTNLFRPVPLHIPLTSSSPDLLFSVGTFWLPPPLFSNNRLGGSQKVGMLVACRGVIDRAVEELAERAEEFKLTIDAFYRAVNAFANEEVEQVFFCEHERPRQIG
jgi:hypothetical protein